MRVWLITIGEPLPTDSGDVRLHRTGILAGVLAERGHDVLWWSSTFDHSQRRHRFATDTALTLRKNYRLRLVRAAGYRRSISLGRLWDHRRVAAKFRAFASAEPRPDVVLCSLPTLELSLAAVEYGRRAGVPVVLDIRDLWPDLFLDAAPRWARGLSRVALSPMFRMADKACAGARAISGVTPRYVDWALACGRRTRTGDDRDFPFGYVTPSPNDRQTARAVEFWEENGVGRNREIPVVCFFGTISHQFDLETVIEAARGIRSKRNILLVLCGKGDRLDAYRRAASDCPNVVFPGWVGATEIWVLMQRACLGLAPYVQCPNFEQNLPNKPIEYFSGGLPVLCSLSRGVLPDLLAEHDCGLSYEGRPDLLAEAICSLCDHPKRLAQMSQSASRLFRERFTAAKVYGEMADYLAEIAFGGTGRRRASVPACPKRQNERPRLPQTCRASVPACPSLPNR